MHGLTALIPSPVGLMLAGEFAEFWPIRVRQLPEVFRACAPFPDLFKVEIQQIDTEKMAIMQPDESIALLAALSGKPLAWAARFADADRAPLLALLLAINEGFFKPPKPAPKTTHGKSESKPAGKPEGWADRIDALVAAGHRFDDVLDFTWDQFVALSEAAARRQARRGRELFRLADKNSSAYSIGGLASAAGNLQAAQRMVEVLSGAGLATGGNSGSGGFYSPGSGSGGFADLSAQALSKVASSASYAVPAQAAQAAAAVPSKTTTVNFQLGGKTVSANINAGDEKTLLDMLEQIKKASA